MGGFCEYLQGQFLEAGLVRTDAVTPALGLEILYQGRHQAVGGQLAHPVAGGQLPQHPQRLAAREVRLSFDKAAQHRVLHLIQTGGLFVPQGRQTPGLLHGAHLIESGQHLPFPAQAASALDQKSQHGLVPQGRRVKGVCRSGLRRLPYCGVKGRGGHPAGIAREGVRRLKGKADRIYGLAVRRDGRARLLRPGMHKPPQMEAARHHQHPLMPGRSSGDPDGHPGFPGQAAVSLHLLLRGGLTGQHAPGVHLPHKGLVAHGKAGGLVIFLPELLKAAHPGLFAYPLPKGILPQVVVVEIVLRPSLLPQSPPRPGGQQVFCVGQVDELRRHPQRRRGPDGRQLGGLVQKRVVAGIGPHRGRRVVVPFLRRLEQPGVVPVGAVESHRSLGQRVCQQGQQRTGVLRSFDQDAVRTIALDDPLQMPGAGRAVMAHGIIQHRVFPAKRDHFRRLFAS